MKHATFSAKILERRRKRRRQIIATGVQIVFVCVGITGMMTMAWSTYHSWRAINAPSWAEFKVNSPMKEEVSQFDSSASYLLPRRIVIDNQLWDIAKVDHFDDAESHKPGENFSGMWAQTYCSQHLIAYISNPDEHNLRMVLWHEVMHAGACLHGGDVYWNSINPDKFHHDGVAHLGEFMSVFAHENPSFMIWAMKPDALPMFTSSGQ